MITSFCSFNGSQVLEKTLRILFETCDISAIKAYTCKQFVKVLSGRINVQDLIFAKEFRGVGGYKPGACVPALELTRYERSASTRKVIQLLSSIPEYENSI